MQQKKDFSVFNNLLGMIKSQSDFLINFLIFHEHCVSLYDLTLVRLGDLQKYDWKEKQSCSVFQR